MSPTRVTVDDDEQQLADLEADLRRLRSRLATTAVTGTHDEYTATATPATTYTLTYIPLSGTCLMALNGHVQREGVDYTVDYDTGIVTVTATQASGDKLTFRYLITDWLVARSLPAVISGITDTFNRADNTTTLGTTSDGNATWTASKGTWGINTNRAYQSSATGGDLIATLDASQSDVTLQVTLTTINLAKVPGILFRYQDTANFFMFRAENSTHYQLWRVVAGAATQIGSITATPTNGDVLKVDMAGSTINAYLNGTLGPTVTDTALLTATKYGLYTTSGDTTSRWDDLTVIFA